MTRTSRRVLVQIQAPRILINFIAHFDGPAQNEKTVDAALDANPVQAVGAVGNAGTGIGVAPVENSEGGEDGFNFDFGSAHCDGRESNVLGSMDGGRMMMMKDLTEIIVLE